jgi:hypothetical protein
LAFGIPMGEEMRASTSRQAGRLEDVRHGVDSAKERNPRRMAMGNSIDQKASVSSANSPASSF